MAQQQVARGGRENGVGGRGLALAKEFLGFLGRDDFAHGESEVSEVRSDFAGVGRGRKSGR